eukprot:GFUD01001910.1.p1 GENE.GFUD01001910.1~~GFUD01001910.1.p1  ORF type:complete len:173 (-),score=15.03 GFUD01001910.1:286-804(-)
MCQLVLVLLVVVAGYAGAAPNSGCCNAKTVGGVNYLLVERANTTMHGCDRSCVYQQEGIPESRICFKQGPLPVICDEGAEAEALPETAAGGEGGCRVPTNSQWDGIPSDYQYDISIADCLALCNSTHQSPTTPCNKWDYFGTWCYLFQYASGPIYKRGWTAGYSSYNCPEST